MDGKLRNMTAIYLLKNKKILLLFKETGRVVKNVWTGSAGGHFESYELNDAKACVLREMREELGLLPCDIENLALRYVALRNTNGEIRQNYYFFAELNDSVDETLSSTEGTCQWFSPEDIPALPMPLTAKYVIDHYLQTGHLTDALYVGVTTPETAYFTELTES